MVIRLSAAALVALVPAMVSAQTVTPSGPVLTLSQISVTLTGEDDNTQASEVARLKTASAGITTCDQIASIATGIGATVTTRDGVALSALPPQVQKLLADLPVGTPSPIFGKPHEYARVLVVCARSG